MSSRARPTAAVTGHLPNNKCCGWCLAGEMAGRDGLRLEMGGRLRTEFEACGDGGAALLTGLGACWEVSAARRLSLTGELVGGVELETFLGRMLVSLLINVPRMCVTSDGRGR